MRPGCPHWTHAQCRSRVPRQSCSAFSRFRAVDSSSPGFGAPCGRQCWIWESLGIERAKRGGGKKRVLQAGRTGRVRVLHLSCMPRRAKFARGLPGLGRLRYTSGSELRPPLCQALGRTLSESVPIYHPGSQTSWVCDEVLGRFMRQVAPCPGRTSELCAGWGSGGFQLQYTFHLWRKLRSASASVCKVDTVVVTLPEALA